MSVLMQRNLCVEASVASWIRSGKEEDLKAWRRAVRASGHLAAIDITVVLRIGKNRVIADAAAAEVRQLEISRRFSKAEFIKFIVHPVAPIKELHDGGI